MEESRIAPENLARDRLTYGISPPMTRKREVLTSRESSASQEAKSEEKSSEVQPMRSRTESMNAPNFVEG